MPVELVPTHTSAVQVETTKMIHMRLQARTIIRKYIHPYAKLYSS